MDNEITYKKELSDGKLCELLLEAGKLSSDGVTVFRRDGPFYLSIPAAKLSMELRKLFTPETQMEVSPYKLNTIIELVKQNPNTYISTDTCNSGKILFRNGIYNTEDGKLHPHDGAYNWATVNANYLPEAKIEEAPVFLEFVRSSLDYPQNPKKTELLFEIIGYALSDYISAKKAFFLIGEPSSGKSKILEFLQRLLGEEDVSQISLDCISSRFNLGQLRGKRLNVCTELPSGKFPSINIFKALTACDRVYGELKGQDGFSYYPHVKLLNAGNSVPFPTNTDGTCSIVERMVFLLFSHSIQRECWNVKLVDDLLAEKDVICSLAVQKVKKLVGSNFEFTCPEDSRIFAKGYYDALDAFRLFIEEMCFLNEEVQVGSQCLWETYQTFCVDNSFPRGISQQLFVQKIELLDGVTKQRERQGGKQITIFKGIGICGTLNDLKQTTAEKINGEGLVKSTNSKELAKGVQGDLFCTNGHGLQKQIINVTTAWRKQNDKKIDNSH